VNGEAIYGTTGSPLQKLDWGRCTKKVTAAGTTLYLHVFNWPADGKLIVPGLNHEIASATLLADGKTLPTTLTDQGTILTLPATAPDKISSTIAVKIKGSLAPK
jgi:alpha-L-fucosidase